jgi:hypothetical protein
LANQKCLAGKSGHTRTTKEPEDLLPILAAFVILKPLAIQCLMEVENATCQGNALRVWDIKAK